MMQLGLEQSLEDYSQLTIVAQASDGYWGVEAALTHKSDLIVMDVSLPRLDGIAATQPIKAALPNVRIVMLTSHTSETEITAALSSRADAYCVKGANVNRLVTAIGPAQEGATYLDPQLVQRVVEHLKPPTVTSKVGQLY